MSQIYSSIFYEGFHLDDKKWERKAVQICVLLPYYDSLKVELYQRGGKKWSNEKKKIFIQSIIYNKIIPEIYLEYLTETIIDGQQRMLSIANFYKGVFGERKFRLKGVQPDLEGLTYDDLKEADQNRLDDSILHATVVKQDTPNDEDSSIYMIFERLNTGGTPLQPQ